MCLTIPSKLIEYVDDSRNFAVVEQGGKRRQVSTVMLRGDDAAEPGDYVLVHVAMAVSKVSAEEAADTLRFLEAIGGESGEEVDFDWAKALGEAS